MSQSKLGKDYSVNCRNIWQNPPINVQINFTSLVVEAVAKYKPGKSHVPGSLRNAQRLQFTVTSLVAKWDVN